MNNKSIDLLSGEFAIHVRLDAVVLDKKMLWAIHSTKVNGIRNDTPTTGIQRCSRDYR